MPYNRLFLLTKMIVSLNWTNSQNPAFTVQNFPISGEEHFCYLFLRSLSHTQSVPLDLLRPGHRLAQSGTCACTLHPRT